MEHLIEVIDLSKAYVRRNKFRPRTLKEAIIRRQYDRKKDTYFLALDQVNLQVSSGEIVGIVGRNGAGKSTLLRLIGEVGRPDEGHIQVNGKIGALLELGAGFHPELTGRENIFINGMIAGLTREEIADQFSDIVNFAELEDSIDNPLRTYSSGMQLRLAFAVSVHTSPDVLLIDEVLAVGDIAFQRKCLERINTFKQQGCAILIVSHDTVQIREMCDRAMWMRDGRIVATGDPENVVDQYENAMMAETEKLTQSGEPDYRYQSSHELKLTVNRKGTMEIEISRVQLLDNNKEPVSELKNGNALIVEIAYVPKKRVQSPIFSVTISNEAGEICLDTNTTHLQMPDIQNNGIVRVHFERLDLTAGRYFVDVGVYAADWERICDYHWHVYPLEVEDIRSHKGILNPPHKWDFT